ncbi:NUDIX hydrolase [Wenzhouxiangella sp. XN79A]|uniref:NUDIX hydrolase n=1 Tax=Wenzhouxiangella sp. XN79A TaxID=2724193 RepID=UPI00144A93CC|nr:NUDIX hydrolase [Wenzhouxiangella sp. XN79A]NKI34502.1 NUDIX hydrolase [Wenzhouxiangella sp. XN79A]
MSDRTLDLLAEYLRHHPDERTTVDRFYELIATTPDCYERSGRPGHITGSAWLVSETGDEVLLTHHRKLDRWLQFGGHSDGDTDPLSVATREAIEESGLQVRPIGPGLLDIDIHVIPARPDDDRHLHYDLRFAFVTASGRDYAVSHESNDLAWVAIDRLDEFVDEPSLLRMARKWSDWQGRGLAALD